MHSPCIHHALTMHSPCTHQYMYMYMYIISKCKYIQYYEQFEHVHLLNLLLFKFLIPNIKGDSLRDTGHKKRVNIISKITQYKCCNTTFNSAILNNNNYYTCTCTCMSKKLSIRPETTQQK